MILWMALAMLGVAGSPDRLEEHVTLLLRCQVPTALLQAGPRTMPITCYLELPPTPASLVIEDPFPAVPPPPSANELEDPFAR